MKTWTRIAAGVAAGLLLAAGPALAADKHDKQSQPAASGKTDCQSPQTVQGQVVAVDTNRNTITVKGPNGTHEFQVGKAEIANYKVGDQIEAKLRSCP